MWGTTREVVGSTLPTASQLRASRDAHAIRTAILVLGLLLAFANGIGIVLSLVSMTNDFIRSDQFFAYEAANVAMSAVFLVLGILLVRMASDRKEPNVRNLIHPALTFLGAYLILVGVRPLVTFFSIAVPYGIQWTWGYALEIAIELPWIVGGVILLRIATRRHEEDLALAGYSQS